MNDTIAAIATAPGAAGLAVLRVSGPEALAITGAVFRGGEPLTRSASHTLHHGWAHAPGDARCLDEVVAAVFRAPRSYTGEDVVELSCHGGRISAERMLNALIASGARLARPGEFTQRAFLSGRIDLAQAEAVADVIHAETEAAHELALGQLAGALSRRLDTLADHMTDALAEVEARVDFAEDVGGVEVPPHVIELIHAVHGDLAAMLASASWGRAVRDGVRVPLVGRPNVGKSSLFNALIGEERAIVTALPGTTRDRVTESIELCGARVTLSDTAGLRETADAVEAIGVARARDTLDESRAVVWVVDGATPIDSDDEQIARALSGKRVLVALNKSDLGVAVTERALEPLLSAARWSASVPISAARGDGLSQLRDMLAELIEAVPPGKGPRGATSFALANPRHVEALRRASQALARAAAVAVAGSPGEIVALELRESLAAIGEVTGRSVDADVLDRIFGRFCIGK